MKLVCAVIKPFRLEDVRAALEELGATGMTVSEVLGCGRQRGHSERWRGSEYTVDFTPKQKVEVLVDDDLAADTMMTIALAARTGKIGDGKVWVEPVEHLARIRTAELGRDAL